MSVDLVDVLQFRRRNGGVGMMVYPFGSTTGASLAIRASYEQVPAIRFLVTQAGSTDAYNLRDGKALDVGVGVIMSDRAPGWGLGTHSYLVGGAGRITGERGRGQRYFAEAGGGVNVGPIGVEIAMKLACNHLSDPRAHGFLTVPLTVRGTLSF